MPHDNVGWAVWWFENTAKRWLAWMVDQVRQLDLDMMLYGNAYQDAATGERIDPHTVFEHQLKPKKKGKHARHS